MHIYKHLQMNKWGGYDEVDYFISVFDLVHFHIAILYCSCTILSQLRQCKKCIRIHSDHMHS